MGSARRADGPGPWEELLGVLGTQSLVRLGLAGVFLSFFLPLVMMPEPAFSLGRSAGLALVLLLLSKTPRLEPQGETWFWRDLILAISFWFLARTVLGALNADLGSFINVVIELLYGASYLAWVLALERVPHQGDRRRAELEGTLVRPAVAVFVSGYFFYFAFVSLWSESFPGEDTFSWFYFILDSYLLLRLLHLWHQAREESRWRWIYFLLAASMFFLVVGYFVEFEFERRPFVSTLFGIFSQAIWMIPFLPLLLACGLRGVQVGRVRSKSDKASGWVENPSVQTLLAALTFPCVHLAGYSFEWLEPGSESVRELVVLVWLPILGGVAMAQHRLTNRRARELERRRAATSATLAKTQASLQLIRERQKTEEQLRRVEARNAAIFRASPSGLLICDLLDGTVREVNQNFEEMCGTPREELLEATVADLGLWSSPDQHQDFSRRLIRGEKIHNENLILVTQSGQEYPVQVSAEILEVGALRSMLCVVRQISDTRRAGR